MKVGSLFSGIGGIEIGFEKQGFETEWFIECGPYAKEILKKRFPNAKIYGDITKIDFKTVPEVDILTGGFPCQDISNAGKRVGIEGHRSSLWKYYLKAISILRPRFALIENVSALVGRGLDVVLCDLAKVGYDAEWHCVSASTVGAPHKRDRVFILAYPNSHWESDESINDKEGQRIMGEVSDSDSKGRQREGEIQVRHKEFSEANMDNPLRRRQRIQEEEMCTGRDSIINSGWWAVEPELGRVVDGIPNRVDRIKCLGNAVVPQVAEVFAKAIREVEK